MGVSVRIRVYLDRTDHLWRVCGVSATGGADPAVVAARVQARQAGPGFPTWAAAMAAAGRMAAKTRRAAIAAAASWQAQR